MMHKKPFCIKLQPNPVRLNKYDKLQYNASSVQCSGGFWYYRQKQTKLDKVVAIWWIFRDNSDESSTGSPPKVD